MILDKDEYGKSYDSMLYWFVTRACNFNCPQCVAKADNLPGMDASEIINIKALRRFLEKIEQTIRISFTGGEPLLVTNIIDAFVEITKKNYISLVTNLVNPRANDLAEKINPERVSLIVASAHMKELEKRNLIKKFISNCVLLKNKGFTLYVTEVAYPYIIKDVDKYRELFKKNGIELEFMAFRGKWGNRKYPDNYTDNEIKIFNLNENIKNSPYIFNRKNKLCNAGYNIAVAMMDGNIQTCFEIKKSLGNIYEDVNFNRTLIKCPFDFCGCPFPVFEPYLFQKAVKANNYDLVLKS